ncbi:MAG: four helix bundle protein [Planctomycetota bacterium]|nr:hypothetical protein [Planctomycetota bacterium]GIK51887.1 MAG: four helix bundle protein [Planctomycetota bacterium]
MSKRQTGKAVVESYRDLLAWQSAMDVAQEVLRLTDRQEIARKYWLVNQIQRAAASVPANIAEGHDGQFSKRMYLKHLFIARGSLAETLTFLELAVRREYIAKKDGRTLWTKLHKTGRILNGLIRAIASKKADQTRSET